ncbi:c-type cytochrome [Methylobacterium sp. CM6257]|jgi:mono/diheme cytochrome c family protein
MRAARLRGVSAALLAGAILARAGGPAAAGDHRAQGRTVAVQLCSSCHVIGRDPLEDRLEGGFVGPSFARIANMPATTGLALNVFLQSHHQRMPSLRLDRDELDAVIDYILSLKSEAAARP